MTEGMRKGPQILADNLYSIVTGEFQEGITDLNTLSNPALTRILRKRIRKLVRECHYPDLTPSEKRELRERYRKYIPVHPLFHREFKARTGRFDPDYMSEEFYFCRVERYFTDRDAARYLDNKCYYYHFFPNIRQPGLVAMRIGGSWLDSSFRLIPLSRVFRLIEEEEAVVVKRAVNSEGGFGVTFLDGPDRGNGFRKLLPLLPSDVVIQRPVRQHPVMASLHRESVNTLRVMSFLTGEEVKILMICARIGVKDSRVDNTYHGGFFVGVDEKDCLRKYGVADDGRERTRHPDLGYVLEGIRLPSLDRVRELVRKAHGIMGHCRLAAWDVAIDEEGEAVLIETNLSLGGINNIQVCNGPLFGAETENILNEVFYDRRGNRRSRLRSFLRSKTGYALRDNLKGILFGWYDPGKSHATVLTNAALRRIDRKVSAPVAKKYPDLTKDQKKEIEAFFRPWLKRVPTLYHRIYTGKSGRFYPDYIPEEQYICDIDRALSDRDMAWYFDHKCYYPRLFSGVKQPETVVMRIGSCWLSPEYTPVSAREVLRTLSGKKVVVKPAQHTEGGEGISFLDFDLCGSAGERRRVFREAIGKIRGDIMVQCRIGQHEAYARLHPASLNTLRIVSLILDGEVVILSRSLKTGVGTSRTDNGCGGGIYCGIRPDGSLSEIGALDNGDICRIHPDSGIAFRDVKLPFVKRAEDLVRRSHPILAHHRLISWDVAIDEAGEAVLIEANLCFGGSDDVQVGNGPFFGKYTTRVLDEVYG